MRDRCPCCGAPAIFLSGEEGTQAVVFDDAVVTALTEIRDRMRGWASGGIAEIGPQEVFELADNALKGMT